MKDPTINICKKVADSLNNPHVELTIKFKKNQSDSRFIQSFYCKGSKKNFTKFKIQTNHSKIPWNNL